MDAGVDSGTDGSAWWVGFFSRSVRAFGLRIERWDEKTPYGIRLLDGRPGINTTSVLNRKLYGVFFMLEQRDPKTLKPHPENAAIYGEDVPDEAFDKSISRDGVLAPLLILPDGMIISGHRRWNAAIRNGMAEVPVIVQPDLDDQPLEVVNLLIACNSQRVKSVMMLSTEANRLTKVIGGLAAERKAWASKRRATNTLVAHVPPGEKAEKTRTIVARSLGVGEKKAEQYATIGKAHEEALERGDTVGAQAIAESANKSVRRTAAKLKAKPPMTPKPKSICPQCQQEIK